MFKYSESSESYLDSFDKVVLYIWSKGDQIEIVNFCMAMDLNLCFKRNIRLVHFLLVQCTSRAIILA